LIAKVRQIGPACLLGICLAGLARPARLGVFALGLETARAAEEKGEEPARELFFKVVNFVVLVAALGYFLRKPATAFFRSRSASIQKGLEEGRKAEETSQAQLQAVEERLKHLEEEVAAFKAAARREMDSERQHLAQATAEEAARILEAARGQLAVAVRGARSELRDFAARQAVSWAEGILRDRLDEAGRKRLVRQFAANLEVRGRQN